MRSTSPVIAHPHRLIGSRIEDVSQRVTEEVES
jgi:hypothetical protein